MNSDILITLFVIAAFTFLIGMTVWGLRRSSPQTEAAPPRAILDPAGPEIQDQAIVRLLRLPHFRRIMDGSVFDYRRGARLAVCDCNKLPYPHLLLDYGSKLGVVFATAGALEHYVAVQEAVAAMLTAGMNHTQPPTTDEH